MMKKATILITGLLIAMCVGAQKKDTISRSLNGSPIVLVEDSLSYKDESYYTLRALRDGAVIVRLKTSLKSVEAYRQAGRNDIAERIEQDRHKQNEKIYDAFTRFFHFCKVYFIYSQDTKTLLEGNRRIFLNSDLRRDTSITFSGDNFVFCEYGSVETFSKFQDYSHPVAGPVNTTNLDKMNDKAMDNTPAGTSSSPATSSGLFFSDKSLNQLQRPFPFVEGVYLDNYGPGVVFLSAQLFRAYGVQVKFREMKVALKAEKKRMKAEKKKLPRYNPFKD